MSHLCLTCKKALPTEVNCPHYGAILCYVNCPCDEFEAKEEHEHTYENCANLSCRTKERELGLKLSLGEIIEILKADLHPCMKCPSYPDECDHNDYFEDCCRSEQSISYDDLLQALDKLKEKYND